MKLIFPILHLIVKMLVKFIGIHLYKLFINFNFFINYLLKSYFHRHNYLLQYLTDFEQNLFLYTHKLLIYHLIINGFKNHKY